MGQEGRKLCDFFALPLTTLSADSSSEIFSADLKH